jgi:hypothetical protein
MKFLRSVIALCSGFASYREFRDLAITTSLKHLLKLVTLLALVVALSAIPTAREGMDWFAHRFDQGRPDFSLHDGKIVTQAQQPSSWGDDNLRFILDTTGKVTTPDSNATYGVLFATDSFLFWSTFTNTPTPVVSSRPFPLRGFPDGVVDGDYFHNLSRALLWLLVPFVWLVIVLFGMLSCLIQAYLFAMVASFMERSMPAPLQLSQLLNIAIHACTPAAIVVTVYTAFHLHDLNLWMVYLIVYGIFLIGATNACRDTVEGSRPHEDDLV